MKSFIALSLVVVLLFFGITFYLNRVSQTLITKIHTNRVQEAQVNGFKSASSQAKTDIQLIQQDKLAITLPTPEDAANFIQSSAQKLTIDINPDSLKIARGNDKSLSLNLEVTAPSIEAISLFLKTIETEKYLVNLTKIDITTQPDSKVVAKIEGSIQTL